MCIIKNEKETIDEPEEDEYCICKLYRRDRIRTEGII